MPSKREFLVEGEEEPWNCHVGWARKALKRYTSNAESVTNSFLGEGGKAIHGSGRRGEGRGGERNYGSHLFHFFVRK